MGKEFEERENNEILTTDPDARLMSNNNGTIDVSYNVQTAVDSKHKLITGIPQSKPFNNSKLHYKVDLEHNRRANIF